MPQPENRCDIAREIPPVPAQATAFGRERAADDSLSREVLRLLTLALDSYLFAILFAMLTTRTRRFSGPKGLSLFLSLVLP
jgi:hypothetical protein